MFITLLPSYFEPKLPYFCGTNTICGRDERRIQYFGWKTFREKTHLEDLGIDGKIILGWILGK
jgi:hypothetical protein